MAAWIDRAGHRAGAGSRFGDTEAAYQALLGYLRSTLADDAWRWFEEHKDLHVVTVRKLGVPFRVRVKNCRPLFEELFGKKERRRAR